MAQKKNRPALQKNKRVNRRVAMVKTVKGRLVGPAGEGLPFRANLVNVGIAGAQICCDESPENRTKISLELDSLDGNRWVSYLGRVAWTRKNPLKSMGRFAVGIHFDEVTPEQTRFLENNYALSFNTSEQ